MTLTELRDSIRRVLGVDLPLGEPTRLTRFTFHARHVERYRDGRILLAGDAAHLFPAPGVALNAGMIDSVNLGWKLAAAIHGWAPAGLLDTYHDERHLAAERTLLHTRAQVALRRGHDPAAEALRELFLELVTDEQPLRRIGALIAGTDIRYPPPGPDHHALTGTFAPDLTLHTDRARPASPGSCTPRDRCCSTSPTARTSATRARDWQHRIDIHTADTGDRPADALLIRPDAHVAWAAAIDEPTDTAAPGCERRSALVRHTLRWSCRRARFGSPSSGRSQHAYDSCSTRRPCEQTPDADECETLAQDRFADPVDGDSR